MIKKFLLSLFLFVFLIAIIVFSIRIFNSNKYQDTSINLSPYMKEPSKMDNYLKSVEGMSIKRIDEKTAQGFHFVPDEIKHKGIIVVYGGSEGSPNFDQAKMYAKEGFEVLSLFMFGQKNQPKTLVEIPLEQFVDVQSYIKKNVKVSQPLTVVGASKGAEYALNLATKYKEINHLILIAPSVYTFNGLDFQKKSSSWTYNKQPLPYVDVTQSNFGIFLKDGILPSILKSPITYRNSYESAVKQDKQIKDKQIPVKDTKAEILMISGNDDQMWNSAAMSKTIQQERPENTTNKVYSDAGHIFAGNGVINLGNVTISVGGTEAGNKNAGKESQELMKSTLIKWHQ